MESNTRVRAIVRVRPLSPKEIGASARESVRCSTQGDPTMSLSVCDPVCFQSGIRSDMMKSWCREFTFDQVLWSNVEEAHPLYATQEDLYKEVGEPVIDYVTAGFNSCVFAFGQTGSGKTFSMMGDIAGRPEAYGLTPRICFALFNALQGQAKLSAQQGCSRDTFVTFSHMEIYNERVRDLLTPPRKAPVTLKVREHPIKGVFVKDLTHVRVSSFEEVMQLIDIGSKNRTVAATNINSHSSRSHAIVTLTVVQRVRSDTSDVALPTAGIRKQEGRVHLVDLAGSERVSNSGAKNVRLREACSINKSLSVLGDVILSLGSRTPGHIPYRNSALTTVLKDSLGGNSHTIMIATVSPSAFDYEETLSTLKYADRAKKVRMHVAANVTSGINADSTQAATLVPLLQAEVQKLKELLEAQQREAEAMQQKLSSTLHTNDAIPGDTPPTYERELEPELSVEKGFLDAPVTNPKPNPKLDIEQSRSHATASVADSPSPEEISMRARVTELEQQLAEREELIVSLEMAKFRDSQANEELASSSVREMITSKAESANPADGGESTRFAFREALRPAAAAHAVLATEARNDATARLVNLNQDPMFSECLVFYLKGTQELLVGENASAWVPLAGPDAKDRHCLLYQRPDKITVINPIGDAPVYINGRRVLKEEVLRHHDRIAFGHYHFFRYDVPEANSASKAEAPTWEEAFSELQTGIATENARNEPPPPPPPPSLPSSLPEADPRFLPQAQNPHPSDIGGLDNSLESALEFLDSYDWDIPSASDLLPVTKSPSQGSQRAASGSTAIHDTIPVKKQDGAGADLDAFYEYLTAPIEKKNSPKEPEKSKDLSDVKVYDAAQPGQENSENDLPAKASFEDEARALHQDLLNMQNALQARMQRYSSMTANN